MNVRNVNLNNKRLKMEISNRDLRIYHRIAKYFWIVFAFIVVLAMYLLFK